MAERLRITCLIGGVGVGKTTAAEAMAAQDNLPHVSISDLVRHLTAKAGLEVTRENCGIVAERHAAEYGYGVWFDEARRYVRGIQQDYTGHILVTGPRRVAEMEALLNEPDNMLIHVRVDPDADRNIILANNRRADIAAHRGESYDTSASLRRAYDEWYGVNAAIDGIAIGSLVSMAHLHLNNDVWIGRLAV